MPTPEDLTGQKFHRLTCLELGPPSQAKKPLTRWRCVCDCGTERLVDAASLKRGRTKSCGCWNVETRKTRNVTHGMIDTPEYAAWAAMLSRCRTKSHVSYERYARHTPDERWFVFENFYADMGPKPFPRATLERKDNDKPYSKDNCIWADYYTQAQNKSDTLWVVFEGEKMALSKAARLGNLDYRKVQNAIKRKNFAKLAEYNISLP